MSARFHAFNTLLAVRATSPVCKLIKKMIDHFSEIKVAQVRYSLIHQLFIAGLHRSRRFSEPEGNERQNH